MTWQRARQPKQKAARMASILEAAASLYDQRELAEISMQDIANCSNLGKASLYGYFKTKEEVFLSLYRRELELWLDDVEARLKRLRRPTPDRVAAALTSALEIRPRYCRLSVILASVVERNLSQDTIIEFKQSLLQPMDRFIQAMQNALPELSATRIKDFLFQHQALLIGFWPMANPATEVQAILKSSDFQSLCVDFSSILSRTLSRLLQIDS